ncbi:hypothetical protein AU196_03125 [Mycobacterium sp. IS-1742]|uniref:hypothetical protein n=1 Tax=Mycobacterium sp. IS-1742 TaxID=1772285 RepID=UPI00074054FB|nr:hypothetical protein [Mycobacterium sp. IS-1742]KUI29896.1 hypothetical protein AU196_03125 [Mycobacterium sp. IS-1742]
MRFVLTALLWLLTTVLLAVAVPAVWAQQHLVSEQGYADLAESAATDTRLRDAMADELTNQITALAADRGYGLNETLVHQVTSAYTGNSGFPGQFAQANRIAHRWMFSDDIPQANNDDQWLIDIAPMLSDSSLAATLGNLDLDVPDTLMVPVTVPSPELRPGRLQAVATWGPWVSTGVAVLAAVCALLTLASSRRRGKGLAALGVSALLVGAAGWAGLEVADGYLDDALNRTEGNFRRIADEMVLHAEDSLHHWLNLTLAAGAALVAAGVVVSMLGGLRRTPSGFDHV